MAAGVLAVVALWRFTPARGAAPWTITLQTPQGTPFAAQDVTLVPDNPQAAMDATRLEAEAAAAGRWQVSAPMLPRVGYWQVALVIRVDDFDQIRLSAPAGGPPGHCGH
ncbi:MAG: hypothetical protein WCZ18_12610 [Ottowia sp.]|nr:hypothetical protein [Ottowia sp.]